MALSSDRNTKMMDGELIAIPVATGVIIYAGALLAVNAAGYAVPGVTSAALTYVGRADESIDNAEGADGNATVMVRRNMAFMFNNLPADAVTQASLGALCYIVDDETVAGSDGAGSRSAAGIVLGVESNGVWVL